MRMLCVMPLQHPKNKEGFTMTPQFPRKAQQKKKEWLSPLVLSILAAVSLIQIGGAASLAEAAECQFTEDSGAIQGMPIWMGTTSRILPPPITVERDIYGGLLPSSVLEVAPYMNNSRFAWGNTENQEIATIGACLSRDIRKRAIFNQAITKPIGKPQAKSHRQVMEVSAIPYNGKRQVLTIRTTPPDIGISARDKVPTIIGPIQEIQKSNLPDERSVSQAAAMRSSIADPLFLFGDQPGTVVSPLQSGLPLSGNEPIRMNLTTAQAMHNGNCADRCP
jgi:hypothetical protein